MSHLDHLLSVHVELEASYQKSHSRHPLGANLSGYFLDNYKRNLLPYSPIKTLPFPHKKSIISSQILLLKTSIFYSAREIRPTFDGDCEVNHNRTAD